MICLSKNEQGAELLANYLAKTLDAPRMAEVMTDAPGFFTFASTLQAIVTSRSVAVSFCKVANPLGPWIASCA